MYNEYTHYAETTAGELLARPGAFGIQAETVDGQDVRAVYETSSRLVERVRRGDGPAFLLCDTYRYYGHHVGDINRAYYRPKQEEQEWKEKRDPLGILARWLTGQERVAQHTLEQIGTEVEAEIKAGVKFALDAAYPDTDEVDQHVYA